MKVKKSLSKILIFFNFNNLKKMNYLKGKKENENL